MLLLQKYINYQNCDRNTLKLTLSVNEEHCLPSVPIFSKKPQNVNGHLNFFFLTYSAALLNETCFYYFLLFSSIFVNHSRLSLSSENGYGKDCFMDMKSKRTYCSYCKNFCNYLYG